MHALTWPHNAIYTPLIADWLLILAAIACLWGLWLLLQFVFDQIDEYHAAWREAASKQDGEAPKAAEGKVTSD